MSYDTVAIRYPGIGTKLVCVSCSVRFYDLARLPAVCPKCGAEQPPLAARAAPTRRGATMMRRPVIKAPVVAEADDDAVPLVESDEDDDEADEAGDESGDESGDEVGEIEDDPVLEEASD